MADADRWTEPGRWVDESGQIIYAWPPEGRFALLWLRFESMAFTDDERLELMSLLVHWRDENSTLVAIEGVNGEWIDVDVPDALGCEVHIFGPDPDCEDCNV